MYRMANPWLTFDFEPEKRYFSIESLCFPQTSLKKAQFSFEVSGIKTHGFVLEKNSLGFEKEVQTPHGVCQTMQATYVNPTYNLRASVTFAVSSHLPFLFQKISLTNLGSQTVHPKQFTFATVKAGDLSFSDQASIKTAFFSNGWQSWSPSGVWQYGQKQTRSRLVGLSTPMLYNVGTPVTRKPSHFSSDMFAAVLDHQAQCGLIAGFLSQKEQFGSLEARLHPQPELKVWANCDQIDLLPRSSLESDWSVWQFFDTASPQPFESYLQAVARENKVRPRMKTPVGWCSWYYYFQDISPSVLQKNLKAVASLKQTLPLDFFQIDDGFEQDVGSWLKFNSRFSDGVMPLANEIRQKELIPGLWLAPFILEHKSKLARQHPDWLLRKETGRAVNSGFVWNWLGKALDLTNPDVQAYVRHVIRTAVHEWGFPYLKLDFLYAAALPGRHHNPTLTRAQILRQALEIIREEAGEDCTLLGCGVPIGSGIGIFDLMRISADVAPAWDPEFAGLKSIFRNEPNMPSARNAIRNILTRANLDPHIWVNDPDCLLVRDDSKLSLPEVASLATAISITGGAFLISDDMTQLNPERLQIAANLLPVLPPNPRVIDLFEQHMPAKIGHHLSNAQGDWQLIALFNWQDQAADLTFNLSDFGLTTGEFLMREYWTGETALLTDTYQFENVPAHGVRLIALRDYLAITYLGSDLHLSQGIELKDWQMSPSSLEFRLNLGRNVEGNVYVWTQTTPLQVFQNGKPTQWKLLQSHIIQIPVRLDPDCQIQIEF